MSTKSPSGGDSLTILDFSRRLPQRMGRYVVLGLLGSGGMGEVFEAYDPELARKIALKVVKTQSRSHVADDRLQRDRARLLREAKNLARLSHPNIVPIYDVGFLDDQSIFVAMELLPGQSLREKMAEGCRHWRTHLAIALQAGLGLAAAHAAGLVHRDVKPENIVIGADGRVCLLDFGLAKGDDHDAAEATTAPIHPRLREIRFSQPITQAGSIVGTPAYLAPEQLKGRPGQVSSDIFAWSCVLFEVLCGQTPFPWLPLATRAQAIHEQQLCWRNAVPLWLRAIVEQGLREQPDERPPGLSVMHQAIVDGLARQQRQRKLVGSVASGVLALTAALGVTVFAKKTSVNECRDLESSIAGVWNPDVAARLQLAFESQPLAPALALWQRAQVGLEEWQRVWLASATVLCEAALHPGSDLAALAQQEAGRACLTESKAEVEALTAIWHQPSIEQILNAPSAARSLSDPKSCVDTQALQHRAKLPLDARARQEVLRLRTEITAVRMQVAQADYDRALHSLQRVSTAIRSTRDLALWSEYLEVQATYLKHAAQGQRFAIGQEVALLAALAADRTQQAAFFANERFYARTYTLNDVASGEGFLADALALTKRAASRPRELMLLSRNRGIWEVMQGRDRHAKAEFERALAYAQRGWGMASEEAAYLHDTLGILAENTWDPTSAMHEHQLARHMRTALLGRNHALTLRSQQGLATALEDNNQLRESTSLRAETLQSCLANGDPQILCSAQWEGLGHSHYRSGNFLDAGASHLAQMAVQAQTRRRSEATFPWAETKLSAVYMARGLLKDAWHLANEGLEKLEAERDFHPFASIAARESVIRVAVQANRIDAATRHVLALQRYGQDNGESRQTYHFATLVLQAEIDRLQGRYPQALARFFAALHWSEHHNQPLEARAQAADGAAQTLLATRDFAFARQLAQWALDNLMAIDGLEPHVTVPYRVTLANILIAQARWSDALWQLEQAMASFDSVQVLDNRRAPIEFAQAQAWWALATSPNQRVAARRLAQASLQHYRDWDLGAEPGMAQVQAWLRTHF